MPVSVCLYRNTFQLRRVVIPGSRVLTRLSIRIGAGIETGLLCRRRPGCDISDDRTHTRRHRCQCGRECLRRLRRGDTHGRGRPHRQPRSGQRRTGRHYGSNTHDCAPPVVTARTGRVLRSNTTARDAHRVTLPDSGWDRSRPSLCVVGVTEVIGQAWRSDKRPVHGSTDAETPAHWSVVADEQIARGAVCHQHDRPRRDRRAIVELAWLPCGCGHRSSEGGDQGGVVGGGAEAGVVEDVVEEVGGSGCGGAVEVGFG